MVADSLSRVQASYVQLAKDQQADPGIQMFRSAPMGLQLFYQNSMIFFKCMYQHCSTELQIVTMTSFALMSTIVEEIDLY